MEMGLYTVTGGEGGWGTPGPGPGLHPLLATLPLVSLVLLRGTTQNFCDPSSGPLCSLSKALPILRAPSQVGGRQCRGGPARLCHTLRLTSS